MLLQALETAQPDDRRRSIERISNSKYVSDDLTISTMGVILRTDPSQNVRRAAARCLGCSDRKSAITALVTALETRPRQGTRRTDAALVSACIESLDHLYEAGLRNGDDEHIVALLAAALNRHPNRDVGVAAARFLRHCQSPEALTALVEALRSQHFAVAFQASESLAELTGHQHGRSYEEWRACLADSTDPFAQAGQMPDHALQ